MRLKDLVHRSALRTRSAGESELGLPTGVDYQVFEVTDLLVQAGTDWSEEGHALGTLTFPGWDSYVLYKLFIESDTPMSGTDKLFVSVDDGPSYSNSQTLVQCRLETGDHWKSNTAFDNDSGDLLLSFSTTAFSTQTSQALPAMPEVCYVGIHCLLPTEAEYTISARAVFWIS